MSVCSGSFQALPGQTDKHHCGVTLGAWTFVFFFLMGFVFYDSFYPTDRGGPAGGGHPCKGGPARVVGASKGGPARARKDRAGGANTGREGSGRGKLNGCIMHQVHTSLVY
jgi:hypothetical protein